MIPSLPLDYRRINVICFTLLENIKFRVPSLQLKELRVSSCSCFIDRQEIPTTHDCCGFSSWKLISFPRTPQVTAKFEFYAHNIHRELTSNSVSCQQHHALSFCWSNQSRKHRIVRGLRGV